MIAPAIQSAIWALPQITVRLGIWAFEDGEVKPAVFTQEIPPDASGIVIQIEDNGGTPWGTRGAKGIEVTFAITILGERVGSIDSVRDLAIALWSALHRSRVTLPGFGTTPLIVQGPSTLADEVGYPGMVLNGTVKLLEE